MTKGIFSREEIEKKEDLLLAPYAMRSSNSRGRVYPQSEHPLRTCFQRDRDRIIHSAAFRRMEYKTQVFIPHEKDHFRTRLTHTIEVAQISRTIARSLGVNEDLSEAIALVHDLGHTPFGHAGEDVLEEILEEHGGFNHNRQSLRVVDFLERRYPEHPGLNLTYEVREGIVKHKTKIKIELPGFDPDESPTLEAVLADQADEITYNAHDIDDGLSAGLISLEDLRNSKFADVFEDEFDKTKNLEPDKMRYAIVRKLINQTVDDVLRETSKRIRDLSIDSVESVRSEKAVLCSYTSEMALWVAYIKEFLFERLYRHPDLLKHSKHAAEVITGIYQKLIAKPDLLPDSYRAMLGTEKAEFVVADYIAGMTDRYAEKKFRELQ